MDANGVATLSETSSRPISHELLLKEYVSKVREMPRPWLSQPSALLFAMVCAVSRAHGADPNVVYPTDSLFTPEGKSILLSSLDCPMLFQGALGETEQLGEVEQAEPTFPQLIDADADFNKNLIDNSPYMMRNSLIERDLKQFEAQAVARRVMVRLLACAFPLRPALSAVERGMKESELLTFSPFPLEEIYRGRQLQVFTEMVAAQTQPLSNFTGSALPAEEGEQPVEAITERRFYRRVSALTLGRLLSSEDGVRTSRYFDLTDQLLLALLWPPPARRHVRDVWSHPGIRLETTLITPAGRGLVHLYRLNSSDQVWLTGELEKSLYGLRFLQSRSNDLSCLFFFLSEEGWRYSFYPGPMHEQSRKPDKQGTVCLHVSSSLPAGSPAIVFCSNGDIRIAEEIEQQQEENGDDDGYPLFAEHHRLIGPRLSVLRVFPSKAPQGTHPFSSEVLDLDGGRELIIEVDRLKAFLKRRDGASRECYELSLVRSICKSLQTPTSLRRLRLLADGQVAYSVGEVEDSSFEFLPQNILESFVDATTKAVVNRFEDGRVIISYPSPILPAAIIDASVTSSSFIASNSPAASVASSQHSFVLREIFFPDGSSISHDLANNLASLYYGDIGSKRKGADSSDKRERNRNGWPVIEVDLDVDHTSRGHASGMEVPINKGGERVRCRAALRDGSAVFIKYDTRLTAVANGSIHLVTRDRFAVVALDNGQVTFRPATAWDRTAEQVFRKDCALDGAEVSQKAPTSPLRTTKKKTNSFGDPAVSTSMTTVARADATSSALAAGIASAKSRRATKRSTSTPSPPSPPPPLTFALNDPLPAPERDAVFSAHLLSGHCSLQDAEHNYFEADLASTRRHKASLAKEDNQQSKGDKEEPFYVRVVLSGEVEGLKPPAVIRNPKSPRLFIVNRDGSALEAASQQAIALMEHRAGVVKATVPGSATRHYLVGRPVLAEFGEKIGFQEVFGARQYMSFPLPASVLALLRESPVSLYNTPRRLFERFVFFETRSLASGDFDLIAQALQRCEAFRTQRMQSIDRFAVDDPRTKEQIEEEEAMVKRLKQAYKLAKLNAAKRREQRAKEKAATDTEEEQEDEAKDKKSFKPTKISDAIAEGPEDEEEGSEDDVDHFSDDEEAQLDPQEEEIRATFEDYAVDSGVAEGWAGSPMMPLHALQDALVRICNLFIPSDLVEEAVVESGEIELGMEEITLHEFRGIYHCLQQLLKGERPRASKEDEEVGTGDLMERRDGSVSTLGSKLSAHALTKSNGARSLAGLPLGDDSPVAKRAPRTAPVLNLKLLPPSDSVASEEILSLDAISQSTAAGSAVNVVRKKVRSYE